MARRAGPNKVLARGRQICQRQPPRPDRWGRSSRIGRMWPKRAMGRPIHQAVARGVLFKPCNHVTFHQSLHETGHCAMRWKFGLFAATILATPLAGLSAARAQVVDGFYIGAGAGVNLMFSERLLNPGLAIGDGFSAKPKLKLDTGYAVLGSVGYGLGNGARVEFEGGYRDNNITGVGGNAVKSGDTEKYSAMLNAIYDFDLKSYYDITAFTPYVGVGVGYAYQDIQQLATTLDGVGFHVHGGQSEFAYQGIAGVAFPLTELVPGLSLTAEYRFFGTPQDAQFVDHAVSPAGVTGAHVKVQSDLNNSVMVGLRYAFLPEEAPPPAPPAPTPAPAPAPSRTYLVFFDWDRADLTARAKTIIADAAANVGRVSATRIEVNGNADRSGTPRYNMGLSLRRAQAVSAELVRDGVRQNMIDIHAYGDTRPLVPTGPGVREPQNRRVEIILH
jgi:outer membrane protein OmpA-like peptidoglycan-associated protein